MMTIRNMTEVTDTLPFTSLLPFQGNLKSSKDDEIKKLADSLIDKGQKTPFFVWRTALDQKPEGQEPGANWVIDGHRRLLAIQYIATVHPEVLQQEYPVVYIKADTIEEAKDALLEMCSTYGKITPRGLQVFIAETNIKVENMGIKVKLPGVKINRPLRSNDYQVLRIKVAKARVAELKRILIESGVEVL